MKIFLVAGKAGSGKGEVSKIISDYYNKKGYKTVISEFSKYLKLYAKEMINSSKTVIEKLGFANEIEIRVERGQLDSNSSSIITKDFEVIIPLGDLVDLDEEKKRLEAEIKKLESEVERASKMLSNPGFTSKAPAAKIEEEKQKLAKYEEMLKVSKQRYENL